MNPNLHTIHVVKCFLKLKEDNNLKLNKLKILNKIEKIKKLKNYKKHLITLDIDP